MKTQCAWCLRYTKDGVAEGCGCPMHQALLSKDLEASHGICNECFQIEMARADSATKVKYYDDIGYRTGSV
jgi:hypothetical protein